MVVALCAALTWLAAVVLVLKAIALWRMPATGGAPRRRRWLDGLAGPTVGPARALPAVAFGSVGLALILTAASADDGSDTPSPWLGVFAVGLLFLAIAYLVFTSVVLFNRPRFLVPPAYRAEQGRIAARRRARTRGCGYCAEDSNMFFGHVDQIASSEASHTLLLRCPRCDSHYQVAARGPARATRLTIAEAMARFPGWEPATPLESGG